MAVSLCCQQVNWEHGVGRTEVVEQKKNVCERKGKGGQLAFLRRGRPTGGVGEWRTYRQ
jgi:hypothetical protein